MTASTVSSINDTLDGGATSSSSGSDSSAVLQKKLAKVEKCISQEEKNLQVIQDELIKLGMSPDRNPAKHQQRIRELEHANDKASRQLEEYRKKKAKYEKALMKLDEAQRDASRTGGKDVSKDDGKKSNSLPANTDVLKTGTRVFSFMRQSRNGDGNGSAKSKESRGSKDDSPAPPPLDSSNPRQLQSDGSVISSETDSRDSQKRQKRLFEIVQVVDEKLDPLATYMQEMKERMEEVLKTVEDSKAEQSEIHKSNTIMFEDLIRRCGYVEEQIHDIIELHQKETVETKNFLSDTQEKMNYMFSERIRDMREEINTLNTRIAKIEHRQKEDESLARTEAAKSVMGEMAFKMVDCLLLFGQLIIAVVGAVSQFFQMTAENSTRLVVFLVGVIAFLVLLQFREELPFAEETSEVFWRIGKLLQRVPGASLIFGAPTNSTL